MRILTQDQIELMKALDDLLAKRNEALKAEYKKDEAVKRVEYLLYKRIGVVK